MIVLCLKTCIIHHNIKRWKSLFITRGLRVREDETKAKWGGQYNT